MTKEQEIYLKTVKIMSQTENEPFKTALETVLNMLKEKDAEIEKYKRKNKELSNQLLKIYKEQDNYNARLEKKNEQVEKKDKVSRRNRPRNI